MRYEDLLESLQRSKITRCRHKSLLIQPSGTQTLSRMQGLLNCLHFIYFCLKCDRPRAVKTLLRLTFSILPASQIILLSAKRRTETAGKASDYTSFINLIVMADDSQKSPSSATELLEKFTSDDTSVPKSGSNSSSHFQPLTDGTSSNSAPKELDPHSLSLSDSTLKSTVTESQSTTVVASKAHPIDEAAEMLFSGKYALDYADQPSVGFDSLPHSPVPDSNYLSPAESAFIPYFAPYEDSLDTTNYAELFEFREPSSSDSEPSYAAEPMAGESQVSDIMHNMTRLIFEDLRKRDSSESVLTVRKSFRMALGLTRSAILNSGSDWRKAREIVREAYEKIDDPSDILWLQASYLADENEVEERSIAEEKDRIAQMSKNEPSLAVT